jgi:metal-responsive CopG/Arc/MetJ family transcriptional regulator
MRKSTEKKRMGRPPTGRTPIVNLTLPTEILEAVDKIAREEKSTRSAIIRRMVADGVRRHSQKR